MGTGRSTKTYLGDGVYVTIQSGALILTTENGMATTNTIVLEAGVWQNLIAVVQAQARPPRDTREDQRL